MAIVLSEDLIEEAKKILGADSALSKELDDKPVEAIGFLMSSRVEPGVESFDGLSPLWNEFKQEMAVFLCTDDPKYSAAREDLDSVEDATRKYIVPGIAGAIGATIGVGAAVLTPFVALALIATVKVGMQAWCNIQSQEVPEFVEKDGKPLFLNDES